MQRNVPQRLTDDFYFLDVVPRRLKPLLGREFGWLGREEGDSFLTGPEIRELCKEVFTKGEEVE